MKNLKEFDKGWFNAFSSFYDEIVDFDSASFDAVCVSVLQGAGITEDEIDAICETDYISDECKDFLQDYKLEL